MTNSNFKLKEKVFNSLNNAIENGYDLSDFTVTEIAEDIKEYDAELGLYHPVMLYPHVSEWKKQQQLH